MDRRLPRRKTERIDRDQPIEFRFEGTTYRGFAGDVLASALWANDVRLLGRSFKYHRPRGIYSLAGHDANIIVEDGSRTNMRGDLLRIEPGLDVRSVNTVGGLRRDRLRITEWFAKFMPVGFYYKAFHTPRSLFPFYENQMRKVAGLGRINPANECAPTPKDYDFCDLLVVGAGPSGITAAITAAEQGLDVLLVDEQPTPGGSIAWQSAHDPAAQDQYQAWLEKISSLDNLRFRGGTQAGGWYTDHWVALIDDTRLTKLRARATLVATGCFEQPAVFQNNDLPGVMLASAAQRLIHLYAVKPLDRAVVLAANCDGYQAALDLVDAGVEVAAIVDPRPAGEPSDLAQRAAVANITIHKGHAVYEAVPAAGKTRISGAVVCPLDDDQLRTDEKKHLDCDGIVMSVGWTPNGGLIYQAGGRFHYADDSEQIVPGKLPAGLFAAGRVNGVFDPEARIADGRRAALAAAAYLGRFDGTIPDAPVHRGPSPSHPYPLFAHPGKKNFIDLDEDVHLKDLVNAHQEGYDNIELMKRFTTVGMGPSQGKLSNINAVRALARLNGASIDETGTTTSRPFYQPVSMGHLAGRRFHPQRRTPMHAWHKGAGAEMMYAGAWPRPEYYRAEGKTREDCIYSEALNVRENVGLIDVGTLGKLLISGPDAVRCLETMLTGRFTKQKLGSLRYALATDETGVIIEDGVVARLADDHFYITATTSGVAAFYREMQRWAMIFNMDVNLVNVTGQTAAMNVAGPNSRELLQSLTDVDLSAEAFPYLGVREGTVAGARAMLMRVGFVGELGYEIHLPTSYAQHVWSTLFEAGRSQGIRPFGVEAQRQLRLEKGHFIVGQDTDALTDPFEANVAWAIGKKKPFFIGSRSLDILKKKTSTRRLVGITFSPEHTGPLPEECQLIFTDGQITGRITSIAKRSTLGHAVALGFVQPDMEEVGTRLRIRLDDGTMVDAEVTKIPFYDPDDTRQK